MDKEAKLEDYFRMVRFSGCRGCSLYLDRMQIVTHRGSLDPIILFIGEAPGETEDKLGQPFVGDCGRMLNKLFTKHDIRDEDYLITNVNLCRPPNNRAPTELEAFTCYNVWLRGTIFLVNPKMIVTLGANATTVVLGKPAHFKMSDYVGQQFEYDDDIKKTTVYPAYHPSYIMRCGPKSEAAKKYDECFAMIGKINANCRENNKHGR